MSRLIRSWKASSLLISLIAAVVLTAASKRSESNPLTSTVQDRGRPECPHDGVMIMKDDEGRLYVEPSTVSHEEYLPDIPELHDCQRFIVRDARGDLAYDSLYAIFARPTGILSFREMRFTTDTLLPPNQSNQVFNASPTAVALITSYGGTYAPLGIRPGVSCLYLSHQDRTWSAQLIHNGNSGDCPKQPRSGVRPLEVRENILPPYLSAEDVPAVARWDWTEGGVQYIGVRCGGRWCEIGPPGFRPAPGIPAPSIWANTIQARTFLVKGWYDRQMLATTRNVAGQQKLVPSGMLGIVVPHPLVDSHIEQRYIDAGNANSWLTVAYVYVDGNVYDTPQNHHLKRFWPDRNLSRNVLQMRVLSSSSGRVWQARYENTGTAFKVKFRPHDWAMTGTYHIPGTARWRWQAFDETTWTRCPYGCCESE